MCQIWQCWGNILIIPSNPQKLEIKKYIYIYIFFKGRTTSLGPLARPPPIPARSQKVTGGHEICGQCLRVVGNVRASRRPWTSSCDSWLAGFFAHRMPSCQAMNHVEASWPSAVAFAIRRPDFRDNGHGPPDHDSVSRPILTWWSWNEINIPNIRSLSWLRWPWWKRRRERNRRKREILIK